MIGCSHTPAIVYVILLDRGGGLICPPPSPPLAFNFPAPEPICRDYYRLKDTARARSHSNEPFYRKRHHNRWK